MVTTLTQLPAYTWLLDSLYDGAYCVDGDRRITYWNPSAERLTGFSAGEVCGNRCAANLLNHVDASGVNLCQSMCPLAQTMLDGEAREASVYLHHRDGHRMPVQVRVAPLLGSDGEIIGGIELFSDASLLEVLRQRVKELESLAYLDALTGIANRRFLDDILHQRFEEWQRQGWTFGVLMADIDHFKSVNDRYGHVVGDEVLRMVSQTLAHNCRAFDIIGRWGGEEFVGVFPHVSAHLLQQLTERLCHLVAASFLTLPKTEPISVTISLGATVVRPGDTVDLLLQRADRALYRSKAQGRNCVTVDVPEGDTPRESA